MLQAPVWERAVHSVTARAFRKLLSIYVFSYFPFGFEGRIFDLIVTVPNHCLSFYFINMRTNKYEPQQKHRLGTVSKITGRLKPV